MNEADLSLRNLIKETGIPLKKLGEGLGMSSAEVLKWYHQRSTKFGYSHFRSLASFLGISHTALMNGQFDPKLVRRRIYEGIAALPEKYGTKMGSRVRTSAHILEFLKLYYGRKFCDDLLLDMNIHPCYFDDLENQISFQFITDLIRKLTTLGFSQEHIQSLARLLPIFIQDSPLGSNLAKTKSYEELYTRIMENIDRFDKNFIYKTQITEKGVLFEASPSEDLHDAISKSLTTTEDLKNIFFYRKSLLGAFPILNDSKELKTVSQKSLFSGDGIDSYWIEFGDQLNGQFNDPSTNRGRHPSRKNGGTLSLLEKNSD